MRWHCFCPAKLNLFLAVGPADARGWHPLRSIFQAVDLVDRLTVELASRDEFLSDADYLTGENTVTKALRLYRERTEVPPISMLLEKVIPAQSGLGGGSSDGAGLLRILQRIAPAPLDEPALLAVALAVGADVPFFLFGGTAKVEGYGEKVIPGPDRQERYYLILKPAVDCSTASMFRALDRLVYDWREFPSTAFDTTEFYNDFERVMPELCRQSIDRLESAGAIAMGLTGSGSAVFGEFETHTSALTARELLQESSFPGTIENLWVCRSLTREESLKVMTSL